MATNIEIKAKVKNLDRLREKVEQISDTPVQVISQQDTFFHTPQGRLKLRVLAPERGELIYYQRQDVAGPKPSNYMIFRTNHPESLEAVLAASLGVRGVVRKQRLLYLVGNTRIHLDQVEGLGDFLEFEVVLSENDTLEQGQSIATELMTKLGIEAADLIEGAYIDLLATREIGGLV